MAFAYFRRHLPGDAHDNGHNYGYLYSSNNSSYEYIVQFLTTGHHIQYVKVSNFLTLWPCVSRITPEMKKKYKNIYICMSTTYVDVTRSNPNLELNAYRHEECPYWNSQWPWTQKLSSVQGTGIQPYPFPCPGSAVPNIEERVKERVSYPKLSGGRIILENYLIY